MVTYDYNSETKSLTIRGEGTLPIQNKNTDAISIYVYGIETVSYHCFQYYTSLVNLYLPDTLITINDDFIANTKIVELRLPKSVRNLANYQPFDFQYSLSKITVDKENPYFCDVDGVLYSKDMKTLWCYPGNRTDNPCIVKEGVTTLKVGAFSHSINAKIILIPSSIRTIEWGFGYQSSALESVIIFQCKQLVKIDPLKLFYGTGKKEDIIHYEYEKCVYKKTLRCQQGSRSSFYIQYTILYCISN